MWLATCQYQVVPNLEFKMKYRHIQISGDPRIGYTVDCVVSSREARERGWLIEMRQCHDSINHESDGLEANQTAETSYYYE